jgi:alpha-L-arabinofuranosidase
MIKNLEVRKTGGASCRIKNLGIGNESWGCGGPMSAEAYVDHLKIYSQFVRNLNPHQNVPPPQRSPNTMQRIAVGPDAHNTEYTETVMKAWKERNFYWNFEGLSLHSYTWGGNPKNAPATDFSEKQYADVLRETLKMDKLITLIRRSWTNTIPRSGWRWSSTSGASG